MASVEVTFVYLDGQFKGKYLSGTEQKGKGVQWAGRDQQSALSGSIT